MKLKTLDYERVSKIFNDKIFEDNKKKLLENLSKSPEVYLGLFRPTKPHTKLIQNITQSHEIRFGDAFEIYIRELFKAKGYEEIDRNHKVGDNYVQYDQLFKYKNRTVFIEQKMRDNHDSTKKVGQFQNFEKKINILLDLGCNNISSYFYFIDDSFKKHKKYYANEIKSLCGHYGVDVCLCYGNELFNKEGLDYIWKEDIINFLCQWKEDLSELPELNFDLKPQETFEEIKDLSHFVWRKLLNNEDLIKVIFPIIFPQKKTISLLKKYFCEKYKAKNDRRIKSLIDLIDKTPKCY
ncbi:MAG: hypothetical protein OXE77_09660 [Flavobacteriaceae bacterium]|nr:hypothetical protein [Flavobacteriaceae bacterium]MCY4267766.1 hypothetical protein [Flavobacteriaceae bacterium]MCY4298541.1 hypothetical protein [Flavobacteriaceae bacterium]